MTTRVDLLCDNPDGSVKEWCGHIDPTMGSVILRYGRHGNSLRQTVIPRSRFKYADAASELMARADKKRREGYYDHPSGPVQPASNTEPQTQSTRSSSPKKQPRESVLSALAGDDDAEWFF